MILPTNSANRKHRLLQTVTVHASSNWWVKNDHTFYKIVFCTIANFHQLFYMKPFKIPIASVPAKNFDDFLICGETFLIVDIVSFIERIIALETKAHRPGLFQFLGLIVSRHDHYNVNSDGVNTLHGIGTASLTNARCGKENTSLTPTRLTAMISINNSVG